jgi:predicted esterase
MKAPSDRSNTLADPHANQPVLRAGPSPEDGLATLVLIHGRGASAESILSLHEVLDIDHLAAIAPQAAGNTWYPHSFLAPTSSNQPYLDSALRRIDSIMTDLLARGTPSERIALLGFSQGACLTSEYIARHPRRYGAAMILTGGLIGPPGTPRNYLGSLEGTPIFIGTSDPDPHVPFERVVETQQTLDRLGANVELRRYPGMPHTISTDELDACRALLAPLVAHPAQSPR